METTIYYIYKSELDAFIADIGGVAVGHTPATPLLWNPERQWPAVSEYITKHGVVLIRRYGDLAESSQISAWFPMGAYVVTSYNQRAFDFATKRPMVKTVTPPPWEPNRAALLSEPEPMEPALEQFAEFVKTGEMPTAQPAPAGVVVQQSLFE